MAASIELGEILHDNCLSCSDDGQMAVALKQEVKVVEMNCDRYNISSETSFSKCSIPAAKEVLDFDVGISREEFHSEKGNQLDWASIELDKTLSPKEITTSKVSSESFCKVAWSKKGGDEHERCLLACLQWDHRLFISRFLKNSCSMKEVINLCDILWNIRRKEWVKKRMASVAEKVTEYTKRKMSLAIVDMAWSDIACQEVSDDQHIIRESPQKKQKMEVTAPERELFTILATAQRDGSVIFWQMKTPVTNESDVSIATEIQTDYHWPTALSWLNHHHGKVHCKDFLAIGGLTGELALWQIMYKVNGTTAKRVCDLWTDKDDMRIDYICWIPCESSPSYWYLLTVKAQHVILFLLSIPTLEEESTSPLVVSHCIQSSLHSVSSSGLCSGSSFAVSCSQDGSLQKIQPSYANEELSMTLDLFERHPPIGPAHRGCAMTVSEVYLSTVTYDHVTRSTKMLMRPYGNDRIIIKRLQDKTGDCTEWIRYQYIKNEGMGFPWVSSPGDLQAWLDEDGEPDEHNLQLQRYLLILQHSKISHLAIKQRRGVNYQPDLDRLAKKISECEDQLMLLNILRVLGKVMAEDVDELSVRMMCDWLKINKTSFTGTSKAKVEKILNHPTIKCIETSQCHEICCLCGEKILFQDLWKDSCSNGHTWKRCNLTLLLCQIKTRSCDWCASKSCFPSDEDCPWVSALLKQSCIFCGGVYLQKSTD